MAARLKICVARWLARGPHLLVVLAFAGGLALAPQASAVALGADVQPGTAFTYDGTLQVESNRVVVRAVSIRFVDPDGAAGLASAAGGHPYDSPLDRVAPSGAGPQYVFRTGSQTDNALTDASGVSFRDSVSSAADGSQTFRPSCEEVVWFA